MLSSLDINSICYLVDAHTKLWYMVFLPSYHQNLEIKATYRFILILYTNKPSQTMPYINHSGIIMNYIKSGCEKQPILTEVYKSATGIYRGTYRSTAGAHYRIRSRTYPGARLKQLTMKHRRIPSSLLERGQSLSRKLQLWEPVKSRYR